MKKLFACITLPFICHFSLAQGNFSLKNLKDLKWRTGNWQRTHDEAWQITTEFWKILPSKEMKGYGMTTPPDAIMKICTLK